MSTNTPSVKDITTWIADQAIAAERGAMFDLVKQLYKLSPAIAAQSLSDERKKRQSEAKAMLAVASKERKADLEWLVANWAADKGAGKTLSNFASLCKKAHSHKWLELKNTVAQTEMALRNLDSPVPSEVTQTTPAPSETAKPAPKQTKHATKQEKTEPANGSQADVMAKAVMDNIIGVSIEVLKELQSRIEIELNARASRPAKQGKKVA